MDASMLCHIRLAHISDKGLQELHKQGLHGDTPINRLYLCENFIKRKFTKGKFNRGIHISNSPLKYVSSDLWASSRVQLNGRAKYFMSVIDNYSRKVWIYTLKNKRFWMDSSSGLSWLKINQAES